MDIIVSSSGTLQCGDKTYRCALGKGGVRTDKKEGDGATPVGCFQLREVLYRADKVSPPTTSLPTSSIQQHDGWCDDPNDPSYNRKIVLPYAGRSERLWRDDSLYDLVVVLGYNDDPVIPNKGSAIFMHVASTDYSPTEGCIALARTDLTQLLGGISQETRVCITP